jgi:hypothetical protein
MVQPSSCALCSRLHPGCLVLLQEEVQFEPCWHPASLLAAQCTAAVLMSRPCSAHAGGPYNPWVSTDPHWPTGSSTNANHHPCTVQHTPAVSPALHNACYPAQASKAAIQRNLHARCAPGSRCCASCRDAHTRGYTTTAGCACRTIGNNTRIPVDRKDRPRRAPAKHARD